MSHKCHARGCERDVPPKLLMCLKHWRLCPKALQREVWRTYRVGQEINKDPSAEYLKAMIAADCAASLGVPVKVVAELVIEPKQRMRVECEAG